MADLAGAITAGLLSLVATSGLLPALIRLLRARTVVDVASERSSHSGAVIRGAGIALAAGMLVGLTISGSADLSVVITVIGFAAVGAWDDVASLPARPRLGLHFALALASTATLLAGSGERFALVLFGVLLIATTTNAVNFMDGVNGITALHAVVWGGTFGLVLAPSGSNELTATAFAMVGAAIAFLPWNLVNARAFLGDSGSYLVGATVGLLSLGSLVAAGPVVALCPLGIYAADTGATMLRRVRQRAPLAQAHHEHAYQRLLELGWSHFQSAGTVLVGTLLCSLAALMARGRTTPGQMLCLAATVGVCAIYLAIPRIFESQQAKRGKLHA